MDTTRRRFLQFAGGAVLLAAGGKMATSAIASGTKTLEDPKAGPPQWAMVVDLKKLAGQNIDHLASACHYAHNVPDFGEDKTHEIKWLWATPFDHAFPETVHEYEPEFLNEKTVPVLCNHCQNPPCVRACPTEATFQREDGIVAMDFHRCIGCRFCVSACPYGARSLNFFDPRSKIAKINPDFPTRTKGVVEKCNFCAERLAKGKVPACVEACKDEELIFGNLKDPDSKVRQVLSQRFALVRKPAMGTQPKVFYVV